MKYYTFDADRIFLQELDVDPLGAIPRNGTTAKPPATPGGKLAQWRGDIWVIVDNRPAPTPKDPEQVKREITDATQTRLDTFAKTRNYDGILSAATYATSTVPKFQQEGQDAVNLRDATWARIYQVMAEVEAGTRPVPESFADVEPLLPALEWST